MLDAASGVQAATWALPPEAYLPARNAERLAFYGEYIAVGPGAASVTAKLQCSPTDSDRDSDFADIGNGTSSTLTRDSAAYAWVVGGDFGPRFGYPRGSLRVKLTNVGANWAGVQLLVWVDDNTESP